MAISYLDKNGLIRFYQIIAGRINQKLSVVSMTKQQMAAESLQQSEQGVLYVTTDYKTVEKDGQTYNVPAFKLGDGNAYIVDLPYATVDEQTFLNHVNNTTIHITQQEREFWNNKNRCEIDENNAECLVMTAS